MASKANLKKLFSKAASNTMVWHADAESETIQQQEEVEDIQTIRVAVSKISQELLDKVYQYMQKPQGTRTFKECLVISQLL
jgi:hypothetical protein